MIGGEIHLLRLLAHEPLAVDRDLGDRVRRVGGQPAHVLGDPPPDGNALADGQGPDMLEGDERGQEHGAHPCASRLQEGQPAPREQADEQHGQESQALWNAHELEAGHPSVEKSIGTGPQAMAPRRHVRAQREKNQHERQRARGRHPN